MQDKLQKEKSSGNLYIWIILAGALLLIVCLFVWACTAQIRSVLEVSGISQNNTVVCYLSATEKDRISRGMNVKVNDNISGSISIIADTPVSRSEVLSSLTGNFIDYTAAQLNLNDWNYRVVISLDEAIDDGKLLKVTVITEAFRPIDFLSGYVR